MVRNVTTASTGPATWRSNWKGMLEAPPLAEAGLAAVRVLARVLRTVGTWPGGAVGVRSEQAVVHALLLVRQLYRSPGDAAARYTEHPGQHEIGHEKRSGADRESGCRHPLPPVGSEVILRADHPHEAHADHERGEQSEGYAYPVQRVIQEQNCLCST